MENKKLVGFYRLFVIMFIFAASMFFLNSKKNEKNIATHIDFASTPIPNISVFSLDKAYEYINPLLVSHNIDLIVKVINQSMSHYSIDIVEKVVRDKTILLSNIEKMEIIFGVMANGNGGKNIQYNSLDFLLAYPELCLDSSPFLILMRSKYRDNVPVFLNWMRDRQKDPSRACVISSFIDRALFSAIDQNDYVLLEGMFSKKIRISAEKASELLSYVVKQNKDTKIVSLLVRCAQADINYIANEKTLLIEAVEQNNKEMIHALLEEGAVVDRVVNPKRGTALQIAAAYNDSSVQQLLKEYGA